MRSIRLTFLVAWLALASAVAQGQVEFKLTTNVQSAFIVADKTIPPGDYLFILNSGRQRLTIRGQTMSVTVSGGHLLYTEGREALFSKRKNALIFRQFGEERFLSAVWINNQGLSISKSKRQKELEKSGVVGEEAKIVIN